MEVNPKRPLVVGVAIIRDFIDKKLDTITKNANQYDFKL